MHIHIQQQVWASQPRKPTTRQYLTSRAIQRLYHSHLEQQLRASVMHGRKQQGLLPYAVPHSARVTMQTHSMHC